MDQNELDLTNHAVSKFFGSSHDLEQKRTELFAALGRVLYEETKDDDEFFLRHPGLYYAIAQLEDTHT